MVKISYDPESDILYLEIKEGDEEDIVSVDDAEILIDGQGNIIALEVWNASKNGLNDVIKILSTKAAQH